MKAYQKPVLYYERFELTQHIASCNFKLNFGLGDGVCTATDNVVGQSGLFINSDVACEIPVDVYCYTNSTAITGTHAS